MNSITNLLDLEDTDIEITDIQIQGQTKTLTLSTSPVPHIYLQFLINIIQFFKIITHLFLS